MSRPAQSAITDSSGLDLLKLRTKLLEAGKTQFWLAGKVGISPGTFSDIIRGKPGRRMPELLREKMEKALKLPIGALKRSSK